jgi:hypothetical protein
MKERAYRFVPCNADGTPRENSELALLTSERLTVGSTVDLELDGFSRWEVVELRPETGPLIRATDASGNDLGVGGTIVCRGIEE